MYLKLMCKCLMVLVPIIAAQAAAAGVSWYFDLANLLSQPQMLAVGALDFIAHWYRDMGASKPASAQLAAASVIVPDLFMIYACIKLARLWKRYTDKKLQEIRVLWSERKTVFLND